ncbi:sensor domain-containing diguanylate cyclase [Humisphaera borealis]|uniref:diguanylate cyclase n=1 Tax=Humisphaera borealis TaxID=2807512 RepID=A0A7M2X284_9BACT|nr:GGDEF domain-containing protein [Humisphaera borealis]QOV91542.1 GGDEF domain-containing protein [Humisphaera borealis]
MDSSLVDRIQQCPNLPSMPAIAMEVLTLAQSPDADIPKIAKTISQDPALSGKILRTVNSSFYGRSQAVGTISQGLVILGLQSVKTLVLGFSLVTNLSKSQGKGFKHLSYWKHSIYAATAARSIAKKLNVLQQEEAFLAALLMDIGMLVLDTVISDEYGAVCAQAKTHEELVIAETAALGLTHADAGGVMAAMWKLPPLLATPIAKHHDAASVEDPQLRKLTELVHLAARCADVFVDEEAAEPISAVRSLCREQHGLTDADADALLADIGQRTKEVATLFEINIGSTAAYEAILKRANEALVEMTLQSQAQASALQEKASTLVQQNEALRYKAETDALTGLANRARFDQFIAEQMHVAKSSGKPLSLLMMDVDKFKSVNDKHGHPTGDKVLKSIGKLLGTAARAQDLAARYGGEEMVLVLPGTAKATAAAIAESIRRAICAKPIPIDTGVLAVSASIGVATFEAGSPLTSPAHLMKAADLAVYAAKHAGRNCVRVFTMNTKAA